MFSSLAVRVALLAAACLAAAYAFRSATGLLAASPPPDSLPERFSTQVQPFLQRYCFGCHGPKKQKASLDLGRDATAAAVARNVRVWELVLERLQAGEMPPENAPRRPTAGERDAVVGWLRELFEGEARRNAGDPGIVRARRLSNAELDYTIHDLTGVDIRPAREFPVDPASEAGFDNSGESLAMSPELLKKYLGAARLVADHVVLKPHGFVFAPHPVVTDTDRDKYCVQRIIDFYERHKVDYADYFLAAWRYRHRSRLGMPDAALDRVATEAGLSVKYLALVWEVLNDAGGEPGPLAAIRKMWRELPVPAPLSDRPNSVELKKVEKGTGARTGCERLRDVVVRMRAQLKPEVKKLHVKGISDGSQSFVLWRNRALAGRHCKYSGETIADLRKVADQLKTADAGLAELFAVKQSPEVEQELRGALERFCAVFPDAFVVSDRGPYFDPKGAGKGRLLTAGFHLMQGYFRDDQPLCELILDERGRRELDELWHELNFITLVPMRQYKDFIFFERAEPPRFMRPAEFDFARSEDQDCISEAKMQRLARAYLARARTAGAKGEALAAIETYFVQIGKEIRRVESARLTAEPSHLEEFVHFARRAYRRPLAPAERDDLVGFYRKLRDKDGLSHEEAIRDTLVTVLLSPHFCYRFDRAGPVRPDKAESTTVRPLSDYEFASRLSYFLWSSMPDDDLLDHAAAKDLHRPEVLKAQTRRMLRDPRVRRLATEFAGNWLDIRRFEEHNAVDRQRFPSFTNELRQAMFEEPIHYFVDIVQQNRTVLDLVYGDDTFVNPVLAKHYGMADVLQSRSSSSAPRDGWIHVTDARRYGRGGLLPMAAFLTRNAPGLRTSPVKRGYWVVRRLLGERIPPPPPTVPELPKDESATGALTLPQLLARHRADKNCAGCHRRFDAIGLVFEDFGPIGERRTRDLGGRPVETVATFPDGKERSGLTGLRAYLREKRERDFVDNLCKKLFSYALGRSLQLSDRKALDAMRTRLTSDGFAFGALVETIVTSPQFLTRRERDNSPLSTEAGNKDGRGP
jgi:hypothetical protein